MRDRGNDGVGECLRLTAGALVGLVEESKHLGVVGKHAGVERLGDGGNVGSHDGDGGVDNLEGAKPRVRGHEQAQEEEQGNSSAALNGFLRLP